MVDQSQLAERYEERAEERRQAEVERRQLINRVGRNVLPKMEGMERILRTYAADNDAPRRILEEVAGGLREVLAREKTVGVVLLPEHVFMNGMRIRMDSGMHQVCTRYAARLTELNMAGFSIRRGFDESSLQTFFTLLKETTEKEIKEPEAAFAYINDGLLQHDVQDMELIPRQEVHAESDDEEEEEQARNEALNAYVRGIAAMGDADEMAQLDLNRRRRQRGAVRKLVALCEERNDLVIALSGVRDIGLDAQNHTMNVVLLSIGIGLRIGLARRDLLRLGLAALTHNIGELALPDGLLDTPRRFEPAERKAVETHPLAGLKLLIGEQELTQAILERALVSAEHHEWLDGTGGYPLLMRPSLHLFSRVVAVCDTFNALTMDRPHRHSFTPNQALKLVIRASGKRLDPLLVRLLVDVVGRFPPGSVVEMDSGEWAVVLGPGEGDEPASRPRVLVFRDPFGDYVDPPFEADCHERHERRRAYVRTVVRAHNPRQYQIPVARLLCGDRMADFNRPTLQDGDDLDDEVSIEF